MTRPSREDVEKVLRKSGLLTPPCARRGMTGVLNERT